MNTIEQQPSQPTPISYTPGSVEWLWIAIAAVTTWFGKRLWEWFTSKDKTEDQRTDSLIELLTSTFSQQSVSIQGSLKDMASHLSQLTSSQAEMVRTLQQSHLAIRDDTQQSQRAITQLAESATKAIQGHQSQIEALMKQQTAVYVELSQKIAGLQSSIDAVHDRLDVGKYQLPPVEKR